MQKEYCPQEIEPMVQCHWEQQQTFRAKEIVGKEKFYCVPMFPYPSGRLHMGHVRNYTLSDVIARYQRLRGKNVLHPIGWDAFGLPAENAAIKHNTDPADWTRANINTMRDQLKSLGFSYDWQREITTCNPDYYCWEQWLFIQLYKKGLAYKKIAPVNWCPIDKTVLANEQVINGRCWRCDHLVEQKSISQWFLKITAYATELLSGLDQLDGWPEQVKQMQRHWIGRSCGMEIDFLIVGKTNERITIYTTRADTLMGVTYVAIAIDHLITQELSYSDQKISAFIKDCSKIQVAEATRETVKKRGIFSGLYVTHPISGFKIPVWITNFVVNDYGTGAVMGVPAHDERDHQFAIQYKLAIKEVIRPSTCDLAHNHALPYLKKGTVVNSGAFLDGLDFNQACHKIATILSKNGLGRAQINFRLRDWGISRQRYWGAPIPMVTNEQGVSTPVPEDVLPIKLPKLINATENKNPLLDTHWINTKLNGQSVKRETDTFDTFMQSSWYYARYTSPCLQTGMLDPQLTRYWLPVDHYIGGIEHATMHLIYIRFLHKVLRDLGLVHSDEPVKRLLCQGMVLADSFYYINSKGERIWVSPAHVLIERDKKGEISKATDSDGHTLIHAGMHKMSKSKNNGIDPQQMVQRYGADTVRLFIIFAAPSELTLEWQEAGVEGAHRFLKRLWKLTYAHVSYGSVPLLNVAILNKTQRKIRCELHKIIAKISDDMERRHTFNTVVSSIMSLVKSLTNLKHNLPQNRAIMHESLLAIVQMLYPITPHISFILWKELGQEGEIDNSSWPQVDQDALSESKKVIAVQINGKMRATIEVNLDDDETTIRALANKIPNIQKYLRGKNCSKIIYRPGKVLNILVTE